MRSGNVVPGGAFPIINVVRQTANDVTMTLGSPTLQPDGLANSVQDLEDAIRDGFTDRDKAARLSDFGIFPDMDADCGRPGEMLCSTTTHNVTGGAAVAAALTGVAESPTGLMVGLLVGLLILARAGLRPSAVGGLAAIVLAGAVLLAAPRADAAVTIAADATNGWLPSDASSAVAPIATTTGRAEVCNVFLGVAVGDPLQTCALGNTRTIPPKGIANGRPLGAAFAAAATNGPGMKRVRVFATQFTRGIINLDPATTVSAAAFDPIDYAVLPTDRLAGIDLVIESIKFTANPNKPEIYETSLSTNLTGSESLFDITVTETATTPVADVEVSPLLADAGWDEDMLASEIEAAFSEPNSIGTVSLRDFVLPVISLDIPADTLLSVSNMTEVTIPSEIPEPSQLGMFLVAILAMLMLRVSVAATGRMSNHVTGG